MDKWICIMVSTSYQHGEREAATNAIKRFFGSDLKEVTFVCDETMWQSGEYYCFVRCTNYQDHVSVLKDNTLFFQVVPNSGSPDWLTTEDVDKFIASVKDANRKTEFTKGDIVNIKEGYLKNLCGLVISKHNKKYKISFHFCTKRFVERVPEGYLKFIGSVFNSRRFAVTKKSIEEGHIPSKDADPELQEAIVLVHKHKIHRKKNRGRVKARGRRS